VTDEQIPILEALGRGEQPRIQPIMRRALLRAGMIAMTTPRPPPGPEGKKGRPPMRRFRLTDLGSDALRDRRQGGATP
jgi:hypothetical protein